MKELVGFLDNLGIDVDQHAIWDNPLLRRMRAGGLRENEWGYVCAHHLRYSSQFTRFLAALIARLPDPEARSAVIRNLIEEEGAGDPEAAHANILKRFVSARFGEAPPPDAEISDRLAARYLDMIETSHPFVAVALLAFACEAIVSRLYSHFVDGMRECGFGEDELAFFTMHMGCDDAHAAELAQVLSRIPYTEATLTQCRAAVLEALDARNFYYTALGAALRRRGEIDGLLDILERPSARNVPAECKTSIEAAHPGLYQNESQDSAIGFRVARLAVPSTVIDPRLLTVLPGKTTELHAHAHESLFYVLGGSGQIRLGGDSVEAPRRRFSFTCRAGSITRPSIPANESDVHVLAITDFRLTRRIAGNTEESYRQKKSA